MIITVPVRVYLRPCAASQTTIRVRIHILSGRPGVKSRPNEGGTRFEQYFHQHTQIYFLAWQLELVLISNNFKCLIHSVSSLKHSSIWYVFIVMYVMHGP